MKAVRKGKIPKWNRSGLLIDILFWSPFLTALVLTSSIAVAGEKSTAFSITDELYSETTKHESVYARICNLRDGKIKAETDFDEFIKESANPKGLYTEDDFYITYWLDTTWEDRLNRNSSFNTVWNSRPGPDHSGVFEVVSVSDEEGSIRATNNINCYYFSYDSLNDHNNGAINITDWVDYLEAVSQKYGKIGRLTIFAHGNSGFMRMSDDFMLTTEKLKTDPLTQNQLKRLKGILTDGAHVLLFSCQVAKSRNGEAFIKELSNLTGAIVHANKESTGEPQSSTDTKDPLDWTLDTVAEPGETAMAKAQKESSDIDHSQKTTPSTEKTGSLSAMEIFTEFRDNKFAASRKYKNKNLIITGTITNFSENPLNGAPGIELDNVLNCYVKYDYSKDPHVSEDVMNRIAKLRKKMKVTVECKSIGESFLISTRLVCDDCELINYEIGHYYIGLKSMESKNYDKAIKEFTKALAYNQRDFSVYVSRGIAFFKNGNFDLAIADISRAIQLRPDHAGYYFIRGSLFHEKSDYDKAIADFDWGLKLDPNNAKAYRARGRSWGMKKNYHQAIMNFTRAIELDQSFYSYYERSLFSHKLGNYDQALADANRVIELKSDFAGGYGIRGATWYEKGDFERAIADCIKATELDPNDPDNYYIVGKSWYEKGDHGRAKEYIKKALEINPEHTDSKDILRKIKAE